MISNNVLHTAISTFYKSKSLLKIDRKRALKRSSKNIEGSRAQKTLSILQMDTCVFGTKDNRKAFIYIIQNNFSRAIFDIKTTLVCSSPLAKENLLAVITKHQLLNREIELTTDDGVKNKGSVTELLTGSRCLIKQLIAQSDIIQSNSMIEACNKKNKYQFLYQQEIDILLH